MTHPVIQLRVRTDRRFVRTTWRSTRFVLAELIAPPADASEHRPRPPVNLAFVLDRSGSMSGHKLALAKEAVVQSVRRLRSDDRFTIVAYDSHVSVVVGSTLATSANREMALARLASIEAGSSTNLAGGWLNGAEQVAEHLAATGVNRTLLLTDGLANVGITDPAELARHAAELRVRGISTTTFGVGADFDEHLLQQLSTAGGGNFYFIADERAIADYVTSEVGEALDVVARDVVLEMVTPEGMSVESLSPFPFERRGSRTLVQLGALVAEQVVQVVLRLSFPMGEIGRRTGAVVSVAAEGAAAGASDSQQALEWEYADAEANDDQSRDVEVDRAVARIFAARARQEATRLNRNGDFEGASRALIGVAKRIRSYARRDAEMRAVIAELQHDAEKLSTAMAPMALKEMHFQSYAASRMRMPSGAAMRVPDDKS
jgi:Ca-activated chloride channel homolog